MAMIAQRLAALELLRAHPGWSDRRVARELHVTAQTVGRWRQDAGLAPATTNVEAYPPPRLPGVPLACGHLIHPENLHETHGRCDYCATIAPIATF